MIKMYIKNDTQKAIVKNQDRILLHRVLIKEATEAKANQIKVGLIKFRIY